jgi:hypothetical protein
MKTQMRAIGAVITWAAMTLPAFAQGPYVSASVVGDIARFNHGTSPGAPDAQGGDEAIGFGLRLGVPVGSSWGVEAELTRPSEITNELSNIGPSLTGGGGYLMPNSSVSLSPTGRLDVSSLSVVGELPVLSYQLLSRMRTTTFSTTAWARQELTSRISLVYLGGLSFQRITSMFELRFASTRAVPGFVLPPAQRSESILYGVRPTVGVEARIGLTEHVELVPGIRLAGLDNGWLVRPAVGLGWVF